MNIDNRSIFSDEIPDLFEDHISIGIGSDCVFLSGHASSRLVKYVQAALVSYHLGIGLDYALKRYVEEPAVSIPKIHSLFQDLYYLGKGHMSETVARMNPVESPTAGEIFSDAALCRAQNTYYVAGLLYREGHLIEAQAMSRMMLEQIAWSYAIRNVDSFEEAIKMKPTKAISALKKAIPDVGELYGDLCEYVHLPVKNHFEFITLKEGESKALVKFGRHSLVFGILLSRLADYWSCVYEYSQKRHFSVMDNWIFDEGSNCFKLNPNRAFLDLANPLRKELINEYNQGQSFGDFLADNWTIDDAD